MVASSKKPPRTKTAPKTTKAKSVRQSTSTRSRSSRSAASSSAGAPTRGKRAVVTTIDRRRQTERRKANEQREKDRPVVQERRALARREAVNRRRQIDPTTCERDYTTEEIAFMNALDDYKRRSGRMFPTCSEVLEVIKDLGYVKLAGAEAQARTAPDSAGAGSVQARG